MPADDRPPSFPFYPRDWIVDTRHLSLEHQARYLLALCDSWLTESYGVAPEDKWREWLGYCKEEWPAVRETFAPRFKIKGRCWTQERMLAVRREQDQFHNLASKGGRSTASKLSPQERSNRALKAAQARWNANSDANRMLTDANSSFASALASKIEPQEHSRSNEHPDPDANGHPTDPDDLTWTDLFASWFWPTYPRKVGKPGALRAWKAIRPQNQQTADAIGSGLERWQPTWTEPRFIPHPATFLNQRRWEDQP